MKAVVGRDLWDAGRFAVSALARPMASWMNRKELLKEPVTSEEVRLLARTRARSFGASEVAVFLRQYAWLWILFGSTAAMVVFSLLTLNPEPPVAVRAVQAVLVTMIALSGMFLMLIVARLTVLRAGGKSGYANNAFLRWIGTPSHVDSVIAALWALCIVPAVFQYLGAGG
ncbi:MAG TPA: hypothetical protein VF062_28175 [Candidatus Limnocylindrales bacterium]